jgi:hypothetical protein
MIQKYASSQLRWGAWFEARRLRRHFLTPVITLIAIGLDGCKGPLWVQTLPDVRVTSALPPKADIHSEMNHATTGCMGDGVCAPDRIELVDQSTYMELGGVNRYAKTASNRLV